MMAEFTHYLDCLIILKILRKDINYFISFKIYE